MTWQTMYKGLVNSPETTITNNISESDTIIYVLDPARVPELPNLMTLGTGTNAETVKVTEISGSAITVERGFQGIAKSWPTGTIIARNFTEYDHAAFKANIEELDTRVGPLANLLTTIKTSVVNAINSLKGELAAHLAEDVTQATVHGLRIQEGTFTPAFSGSTATGVFNYHPQIGHYTKIGKRVFFELTIGVVSVTTPASGNLRITGLPFTSKNVSGKRYAANISRWEYLPLVADTQLGACIEENTSWIGITSLQNNGGTVYVDSSGIAANSYVVLSGSYESAV